MAMVPGFGEVMVPARIRLAATIAFTALVAPAISTNAETALIRQSFPSLVLGEVIVGLSLGFALRLQIMALQITGTIAAQATSLSQLLGGAVVDPQPAIGFVFLLAALALAAHLGLHAQIVVMFLRSYELSGFGGGLNGLLLSSWAIKAVAMAFDLAIVLAAPFVAVSLIYNLALGVINRAMPQLMVAFVGAPAITLGALVLLALSAPTILAVWLNVFADRLASPFGLN